MPDAAASPATDTIQRIIRCVAQVLAKNPTEVAPQSRLLDDLGADSLDLVELMYVLEDEFTLKLDKQDLSLSAQLGLPENEVHKNEVLTPKALDLLRQRYPQAEALLQEGVTRASLSRLLTVETLAAGIEKKLVLGDAAKKGGDAR